MQCVTIATTFALVSFACGSDGPDEGEQPGTVVLDELSAPASEAPVAAASAPPDPVLAAAGEEVALDSSCAGCHGRNFAGATGPSWIGLAGSTVTLSDGRQVVADEAYLRRAIVEPDAESVDGYVVKMPALALDDDEIDALIAFISSLGSSSE